MALLSLLGARFSSALRNPRRLLRSALVVAVYLCVFIVLDYAAMGFEGLPGVVAWYPAAGLGFALVLVVGARFAPALAIASLLSSLLIFRLPQPPGMLLLWALVVSLIYGVAAAVLRHRNRFDWRLRRMRDAVSLVLVAVLASALLAVLSVFGSALGGTVTRSEVPGAIFDWWVGETVGVLTVTPFLLVFVMPWLRRFVEGRPVALTARRSFPRPALSTIWQAASLVLVLYWVFGAPVPGEFRPLYLTTLPLIWIALQHGFRRVTAAIMGLNAGVMVAIWLFGFHLATVSELELMMIGNCLVALTMGAVVTERKQVEEFLRYEISRRRILVDQSTDGIVVLDQEGKVYEANESYARMLGYSMEEIYQLHVWDWESQFPKEQTLAMLSTVDEKGDHFETRHRRKDGTLYDVEISTNGAVVSGRKFIFCVCRDVTGRKQAEEALLESRERLAFALDSANLGTWDWNPQTGVVVYSDLWAQLLEYGLDEIEPTADFFKRHVHPEDLPAVLDRLAEHLEGRRPEYESTYRLRTKSGRWLWVHDKGAVVARDEDGRPTRAAGVVLDITEGKRNEQHRLDLERQIQQSQKLESLGVLAGGIAHDFNNILTSVLGNADLALTGLPPSAPARENLSQILASSRRAADLCQQMLAYSGRGSFVIEPMDLGAFINGMRALLESVISKKHLLAIHLEKDLPLLECDSSQILQLIMNLVMNASEAIGESEGTITISTGARECSGEYLKEHCQKEKLAPGRYLTLEVSDTGCGMDAETQDLIFDPFFTTKSTGRGLGLAGVGGIVRGHQGAVEVRSEPGKGTTFVLLLPAMAGDEPLPPETGVTKYDRGGSGTVLLVDDEEAIRTLGTRMLSSLGFAARTAADGREALEVYREHQEEIALVIMDLTMPRLDGWETFQQLRAFDPQARVLLSSGYTESDAGARFGGQGLAGFLHKPYGLAEFEKQLRASLEGGETAA